MKEKFKYAPGKPGFGTKGDKGEDGLQGLSMYFTDLNPNTERAQIETKIQDNTVLWKNSDEFDYLPEGRVYVTGDLFFDSEGNTYEINAETNTFEYKFASLNMGGYFISLGVSTDAGFNRYFNSNSSPKFIIDNVYTQTGAINYTNAPSDIYNTLPEKFTRIEYTNVKPDIGGKYNAFTLYSTGDNVATDNHKALALIYDEDERMFRLGNLDSENKVRNTNLIFDVSGLIHNKDSGNSFTKDTPLGAVLTNKEIAANSLFDPNFNSSPSTFIGNFYDTSAMITWPKLSDFTGGESDVYGDLYFYEYILPYDSCIFKFDASALKPMIFSNVNPQGGEINITGLKSTGMYSYYMKLNQNGWSRNSDANLLFKAQVDVTPTDLINEPSTAHILSSPQGFNVTANGPWTVSFLDNPDWITDLSVYYNPTTYDGSIHFGFTDNEDVIRKTVMRVSVLDVKTQDVSIWQKGAIEEVTFGLRLFETGWFDNPDEIPPLGLEYWSGIQGFYTISQEGLPDNTIVDVSVSYVIYATNNSVAFPISGNADTRAAAEVAYLIAGLPEVSIGWTKIIPKNSTNGTTGVLTYQNLSNDQILGNNNSSSLLYLYVEGGIIPRKPGNTYNYDTTATITSFSVKYVSGPPIRIKYLPYYVYLSTHRPEW